MIKSVRERNIAIIPARGGSKRLPGKNLLDLHGRPLLHYSIEYAKSHNAIFDQIIITTDDPEIKAFSLKSGVVVIDRPEELSSDTATTVSAMKHVLENIGEEYENVVLLQPTNPLRPKELLKDCWNAYIKSNYDSLLTVSRNQRKLGIIEEQSFSPVNYSFGVRSQDLPPLYYENGLLYISKSRNILQEELIGKKNYAFVVDHSYGLVDIDTQEDLEFAEYLLSKND